MLVSILLLLFLHVSLNLAKPIQTSSLNPSWLNKKFYSNGSNDDANVALLIAATQGLLAIIPTDNQLHNVTDCGCQDPNTKAPQPCGSDSSWGIAVLAGYGPCTFVGLDSALFHIPYNNPGQHVGVTPIGAPQPIIEICCGSNCLEAIHKAHPTLW